VREAPDGSLLRNRDLEGHASGLVCGITTAGAGTYSVSVSSGDQLIEAYGELARRLGFRAIAVPRQVHGIDIERVDLAGGGFAAPSGGSVRVILAGRVDGLVTSARGLLLASTAADCVPASIVDPIAGVAALVHAGWRGAAGGILGSGIERAVEAGADRSSLRVHLGPAICGACYEVDRPVLEAFGTSGARAHLDLRGRLVEDALGAGVPEPNVTVSTLCTKCGEEALHSHRGSGAEAGRMAAFTGFRGA